MSGLKIKSNKGGTVYIDPKDSKKPAKDKDTKSDEKKEG